MFQSFRVLSRVAITGLKLRDILSFATTVLIASNLLIVSICNRPASAARPTAGAQHA